MPRDALLHPRHSHVIQSVLTDFPYFIGRPDLDTVLTKLHVFRLIQYSKILFLDADVLPIRPLSHLFTLPHDFAAVPDVGWPDIFNSGVLLLTPGEAKFTELNELLKSKGSWDGGDQGLLNEWRGDNWHRLSFTYNTTPTAAYTSVVLSRRPPRFQLTVSSPPSAMLQLTNGMVPKSQLYTLSDRTSLGTL